MNDLIKTLIGIFVLFTLSSPLAAQENTSAMDPEVRIAAVDSVAALVEYHYVMPDTGRIIADHIRMQARAGAYQKTTTLSELAQALTEDLQAVNGDLHLNVNFNPTQATALSGKKESASEEDRAEAQQRMTEAERQANYFIENAEILAGNVGYLRINQFSTLPEAFDVLEQALGFLERTDAMILDLRMHGGGSARMANFLISHFTEPDLHSLDIYWRDRDELVSRHTLEEVPGPRRTNVPLYVLVSPLTGSAGEDVPFVLQNLNRATVVGETTAGMGRNNRHFTAGKGLVVSVSVSRVMEPGTGREWEQVGVIPDLQVRSDEALTTAHLDALEQIARKQGDKRQKELAMLREYVEARHRPVTVPAELLSAYAGSYESGAEVMLKEGELHFRPGQAMPLIRLVAFSEKRFSFGPTRRVIFNEDSARQMKMEVIVDGRPFGIFTRMD